MNRGDRARGGDSRDGLSGAREERTGEGQVGDMEFIRGNEIYDHLEKGCDRFDDVANQIQGIVVEHV